MAMINRGLRRGLIRQFAQGIAPEELDAYARFPGGPVLADRSVLSQLLMGNGPVAWVFTRQSGNRLRNLEHIGPSRSVKSPARGIRPWQNQGFSQMFRST
jgi:hypothetical protein